MLAPETQRLLKANAVRELGQRVAYNFEDLRQQGDAYLDDVRLQAAELYEQAQLKIADIRERTIREARDAGRKEGLQEAAGLIEAQAARLVEQQLTERVQTTLPILAAVADELKQERERWLLNWEERVLRLAISIAEKLLRKELQLHPQSARPMIQDALQLAAGQTQLRIQLHPDDLRHFGDRAEDVVRTLASCTDAVLLADPDITPGGCRIETRHGEIDARLETLLERMAEELLE